MWNNGEFQQKIMVKDHEMTREQSTLVDESESVKWKHRT